MYPQKQKTWTKEEHEEIIEDTLESSERIIKSRQRHWCETFESEEENTWGNRLLRLTMNNIMIQWVIENTKFRCEDKLS